jgi:hypothetical protein
MKHYIGCGFFGVLKGFCSGFKGVEQGPDFQNSTAVGFSFRRTSNREDMLQISRKV